MSDFVVSVRESGSAIQGMYRRLMDGRWKPIEWERFELGEVPPDVLEGTIAAWQARLLDEYRSATVFSQFQSVLLWAGMPNDVLGCASRVVQDELRHVQLCGDLIHALGGAPSATGVPEAFVVPWNPALPLERQVLEFALQYFCLGEQVSSRLIDATWKQTGHPFAREVLRRLSSDERFHAEFGWTVAGIVWPHASEETREAAIAALPAQLADLEHQTVSYAHEGPLTDVHLHLGSLTYADHRATFYRAVEETLLPRLEALGLPARRAWARRAPSSEAIDLRNAAR